MAGRYAFLLAVPFCLAAPTSVLTDRDAPLNSSALCDAVKNQATWNQYNVGKWLTIEANSLQPYNEGLFNKMQEMGKELVKNDWNCTIDNCNGLNVAADNCYAFPQAYFTLYSIQNFMQFWRNIRNKINEVASQAPLGGGVPNMVEEFTYVKPAPSAAQQKVIQGLDIALAVVGALFSVVGGAKGKSPLGISSDNWKSVGDNIKLAAAVTNSISFSTDTTIDADPVSIYWANYANVSATIANQQTVLVRGIEDFTYKAAFGIPPTGNDWGQDPNGLPSILFNGSFAAPPADITNDGATHDAILAGLSAAAINNLWNYDQVIVTKINKGKLSNNVDICVDGKPFPAGSYYCSPDKSVQYNLWRWPTTDNIDQIYKGNFKDLKQFNVNGIDQLPNYAIGMGQMAQAAEKNQALTNGNINAVLGAVGAVAGLMPSIALPQDYWKWPTNDQLVDHLTSLNPNNIDMSDTLRVNLPFCDLNTVTQYDTSGCKGDVTCIWQVTMFCGCRALPNWPYWTSPSDYNGVSIIDGSPVTDSFCKVKYNEGTNKPRSCVGSNCMDKGWLA